MTEHDYRSVVVLAEPVFDAVGVRWRGMAFVEGRIVNHITGIDREAVFEDCVDAAEAALVPTDSTRKDDE